MLVRVIPKLDIKGPNLVKGVQFEGLRVLGKPWDFARHYYEGGADELFYMDAVASYYGRNSLLEIVERTAAEIMIPLSVGGGLRNLDDIRTVLRAGADKVALNTAAVNRPRLISEAANAFGSSTITVMVEALKHDDGRYEAYVDYGRQETGLDAFAWARRAAELGAGELIVTSINREGTGEGYDLELTRRIAESVGIPVIAAGGAGRPEHVAQVVKEGRADAVCLASLLHYECVRALSYGQEDFRGEGNIEHLLSQRGYSRVRAVSIAELKDHLRGQGIACRFGGV